MSTRIDRLRVLFENTPNSVGSGFSMRSWPSADDVDNYLPQDEEAEFILKAFGNETKTFCLVVGQKQLHFISKGYVTRSNISLAYSRITDIGLEKLPLVGYSLWIGHSGQYTERFNNVRDTEGKSFVAKVQEKMAASASGGGTQSGPSDLQKVKDLKEMLDSGLINQDEFDKAKAKILGL